MSSAWALAAVLMAGSATAFVPTLSPSGLAARPHRLGLSVRRAPLLSGRSATRRAAAAPAGLAMQGAAAVTRENPLKVIIAGGGVGGMFLAKALQNQGMQVTVLEKTGKFARFGGPIQLASNALATIKGIDEGLFDKIMKKFTFTGTRTNGIKDGIRTVWYTKFEAITKAAEFFSLPYTGVIDRPDLQEVLLEFDGAYDRLWNVMTDINTDLMLLQGLQSHGSQCSGLARSLRAVDESHTHFPVMVQAATALTRIREADQESFRALAAFHQELERLLSCEVWCSQEAVVALEKARERMDMANTRLKAVRKHKDKQDGAAARDKCERCNRMYKAQVTIVEELLPEVVMKIDGAIASGLANYLRAQHRRFRAGCSALEALDFRCDARLQKRPHPFDSHHVLIPIMCSCRWHL